MRRDVRRTMIFATLFGSALAAQTPQTAATPIARFVEVEPDVKVEVLDWGGSGRPVVLVHGHGRSAHDFDTFAPLLATTNRVVAISRRGYGASSKPATGYSADRLADDVLAVIDSLGLVKPVLAGHSLGGEELSSIGSRFPERVSGLVYLDAAYDYAFYVETPESHIDLNEVRHGLERLLLAQYRGNAEEVHRLVARLRTTDLPALDKYLVRLDERTPPKSSTPPKPLTMLTRPGPDRQIFEGTQRFTSVRAPVLAIFALKGADSAETQQWLAGNRPALVALKRAAPSARVLILPKAPHDIFKSNASEVLQEMRAFFATLPPLP